MGGKDVLSLLVIIITLHLVTFSNALERFNESRVAADDGELVETRNWRGEAVLMTEYLARKLSAEASEWHWQPWIATRTEERGRYVVEVECIEGSSVDSFPESVFTDDQLRKGGFLLYILFGIYSFTLVAIVCNDYFIPCVEFICDDMKIPPNVGAATFMAVATSCPEFFVNVISTFLTESDMGIGTIVGSALFNALGVAAIGSIAAVGPISIDRRPVTRDVLIYMFNVSVLVAIVWDGVIFWYEALILGVLYIFYFVVMFNSTKLFILFDKLIAKYCKKENDYTISESGAENGKIDDNITGIYNDAFDSGHHGESGESGESGATDSVNRSSGGATLQIDGIKIHDGKHETESTAEKEKDDSEKEIEESEEYEGIFSFPKSKSVGRKIWWVYSLPLRVMLGFTIPSPRLCRRIYPVAFVMCIVWIGVNSYFVSWSMTVIGHAFLIPDSIMGMTFLAFGGCLPEAVSIYIMSRRGEGAMGVSNALGANSLAILFALGVPWLIRTLAQVARGEEGVVLINSSGIDFVVGSLLVAVTSLWLTLYLGKFVLRKRLGVVLATLYLIFITFAILVEMGIILERIIRLCN